MEKKDGYYMYFMHENGIIIRNPIRDAQLIGGSPYHSISNNNSIKHRDEDRKYHNGIFGFSNDLGTDIAIASLLYF